MEQVELSVTTREILGKKTRFLRRQGITPVHLFGHGIESAVLQCDAARLKRVLAQAGQSRLISLKLDKAKEPRNVVVREVQREPLTGQLIHVDFYEVSLTEKIRVEIPIVLVGESPALKAKENFLMQELDNLAIECLPAEIPDKVELDIGLLTDAEQAIHVEDIALGDRITILNNPEQLVVKIGVRREEKAAAEVEVPGEAHVTEGETEEESSSAS